MRQIIATLLFMIICANLRAQNIFGFSYSTNEQDSVIVINVLKNSPADKAGLKVGDFLNFLNDIPLSFKTKEQLQKILSDAPVSGNILRFYRKPDVLQTTISKAPLSSFEFSCISGDCNSGDCVIESVFGYTIQGKCVNQKISGKATCYYTDGTIYYQGQMINNLAEGAGVMYFPDNHRFEGTFKNGQRNGSGTFYYPDKNYLTGIWVNNKIEGNAVLHNPGGEQIAKRVYMNGVMEKETKIPAPALSAPLAKNPEPVTKTEKIITKDPAINKAIREKMYYIYSNSRERYFSDNKIILPQLEKAPFDKEDMKEMSAYTYTTVKESDYILEQCKLENYPAFYRNHPNVEEILNGPFRNLKGDEVMSFKIEVDGNGFKKYNTYSILFISTANNQHAPNELLADDGYGFFICVNNATISDKPSPKYVYTPFTLNNYRKDRGFKNWADKKRVYLVDMYYIYENFSTNNVGTGSIQQELNISESELQQLKEWCNISNAPEGLNTLTKIKDAHRNAKLMDAVAYEIYKGVYYMPANENRHLESAYQPKSSEGWYFCTSPSIINNNPTPESYRQSKLAGTDANMEKYRREQAAREAKMEADAIATAEWRAKNKFKGVIIYQFEEWDDIQKMPGYKYKIVSIFGPVNQSLMKSDKINIDKLVGADIKKESAAPFKEGMDETQAIAYVKTMTNSDRFSVNTNYSYTIPEKITTDNADELEKLNAELEKNQKERDKLFNEMMESNATEKIEQTKQAMQNVLTGSDTEIARGTEIQVSEVGANDKNYNELKQYIGQKGMAQSTLKRNTDGTYSGIIEFYSDFRSVSFESVRVKIVQ